MAAMSDCGGFRRYWTQAGREGLTDRSSKGRHPTGAIKKEAVPYDYSAYYSFKYDARSRRAMFRTDVIDDPEEREYFAFLTAVNWFGVLVTGKDHPWTSEAQESKEAMQSRTQKLFLRALHYLYDAEHVFLVAGEEPIRRRGYMAIPAALWRYGKRVTVNLYGHIYAVNPNLLTEAQQFLAQRLQLGDKVGMKAIDAARRNPVGEMPQAKRNRDQERENPPASAPHSFSPPDPSVSETVDEGSQDSQWGEAWRGQQQASGWWSSGAASSSKGESKGTWWSSGAGSSSQGTSRWVPR